MKIKILLIDNYDSFTYNLAQYFWELGFDTTVKRNDQITLSEIEEFNPSHIVISPGPGTPRNAGISKDAISSFYKTKPILGVCLGHQCIGEFFGSEVKRAPLPRHGKVSLISHEESILFKDIPNSFRVTRYHSLVIPEETINKDKLKVIAKSNDDNLIMAFEHKQCPIFGVQFHPESIMTEYGHKLLKNFVEASSNFQSDKM
ncbi:MAG: aminodeoxychorismate/anthranilate synthase component II [Candidatus Caenarcaniphilales bacterium]|nr:aminodeoxychorismate/anthranilate synthase component II [Candidatus Caenarcaniphilales bacterium]